MIFPNPRAYALAFKEIREHNPQELETLAIENGYEYKGTFGPYIHARERPVIGCPETDIGETIVVAELGIISRGKILSFLLDSSYKNPNAEQRMRHNFRNMPEEAEQRALLARVGGITDFYFDLYNKQNSEPHPSLIDAVKAFKRLYFRRGVMENMGRCGSTTGDFIRFCKDNFGIGDIHEAGWNTLREYSTPDFPGLGHVFALRGNIAIDWTADQFGMQESYPLIFDITKHEHLQRMKKERSHEVMGF